MYPGEVEPAITTLKEAITQIEEMRDKLAGRPEGRHLFFENKVGPSHTLVKLLAKQGKDFEALLYAEQLWRLKFSSRDRMKRKAWR